MKTEANVMWKIWSLLMLLLLSTTSYAYDAKINGIYYHFDYDSKTAEVTYKSFDSYSGNISIPDNVTNNGVTYQVTSIGQYAFSDCSGLTSIKVERETPISIDNSVFPNSKNATLYVPKGSRSAYQSADCWKDFKEIVEYSTTSTYSLSITSLTGGSVTYAGNTISGTTKSYTVNEGASATLTFTPNSGYRLKSVVVDGTDVTAAIVNNQYTISSISQYVSVLVTFMAELEAMTVSDVNYTVTSYDNKTVNVAAGAYGKVLTVPASFKYDNQTWTVKGIDNGALVNETSLAAIIWNPNAVFTEKVSNPNLLLYVKAASYAPSSMNNVIVNNVAQTITLTESLSGNDFYCPQAFTAKSIKYFHNYQMTTGIDKCQGWETIALPFDVQTVTHATKGTIVPFAARSYSTQKAFWLYELTSSGWKAATAIKANTPYIISMPNNDLYYDEARLNGRVTFSATDVTVPVTSEKSITYRGRTFVPNFKRQYQGAGFYALNVNNDCYTNYANGEEGGLFVVNLRNVSPFEAYMTTSDGARMSFGVFEDTATKIRGIEELIDAKRVNVYNLNGQKRKVGDGESMDELKRTLPAGVYIINGQKVIVR